jgi:2-polyprenyl-6-methoxyphenol hydroxylase-like FAD-dependent oxidoreductase
MSSSVNANGGLGNRHDRHIKVAIIGAGISGLSVANGLLKDKSGRFNVQVYERDTIAFDSERGGYQIRICKEGLNALRIISDDELWSSLRQVWAGDSARAPSLVDPKEFNVHLRLAQLKLYPTSRPLPRQGLRHALLKPLLSQDRVHLSHQLTHFEYLATGGVQVHFKNGSSHYADMLIAADGSNSQINRQVGLNNKVKLDQWTLIQSRGSIDSSVRDRLPRAVLEEGAVLFLGGRKSTGFVSVYDPQTDANAPSRRTHTLFWSLLVPSAHGKRILQEGNNDATKVLPLLEDYLCNDLGYGNSLPFIMKAATAHFRTGLLTSSVKPPTDWRKTSDDAYRNSRVILLGDAVHPMTPGRGMGANQALTDAGELVKLLHAAHFEKDVPNDAELADLVEVFEKEMYGRAFKMVQASEAVTDLDLTTWKGRALLAGVGAVMTVLGWGVTLLELVGLKHKEEIDFMAHHA